MVAKVRMNMKLGKITIGARNLLLEFVLVPGKKFDKVKLVPQIVSGTTCQYSSVPQPSSDASASLTLSLSPEAEAQTSGLISAPAVYACPDGPNFELWQVGLFVSELHTEQYRGAHSTATGRTK